MLIAKTCSTRNKLQSLSIPPHTSTTGQCAPGQSLRAVRKWQRSQESEAQISPMGAQLTQSVWPAKTTLKSVSLFAIVIDQSQRFKKKRRSKQPSYTSGLTSCASVPGLCLPISTFTRAIV